MGVRGDFASPNTLPNLGNGALSAQWHNYGSAFCLRKSRINRRDKAESAENKKRLLVLSSSSLLFSLRLILHVGVKDVPPYLRQGALSHKHCPGPPSPKTARILVGCFDRRRAASPTGMFKKFLVEGFGAAPCERSEAISGRSRKGVLRRFTPRKGSPRILIL